MVNRGSIEGVTGWAISPRSRELMVENGNKSSRIERSARIYCILLFYDNRDALTNMMKSSIGKIAYYFHSHRMMRRYATEAYL
jgi:starch phosphorylase